MRIDKFLKVSRILKRRTVGKDACEFGRVFVNGKQAKPSCKLKIDDVVSVQFGEKLFTFKVLKLSEHVLKEESSTMYEVVNEVENEK